MAEQLTYQNPEHTPLKLREFGRNVQQMVDHLKAEADPQRRQQMAEDTIRVMKTIAPQSGRDPKEAEKKLWDQLFRLADYDLDIEAPVEVATAPPESHPPEPMPYYPFRSRYMQYGKNVELMIHQALQMEDGEERQAYIRLIASYMKQCLKNRDRSSQPSDHVVVEQLAKLSDGRIQLDPADIEDVTVLPPASQGGSSGAKKKKSRGKKRSRNNKPGGGGFSNAGGNRRGKGGSGGPHGNKGKK